ncbi:MAG: vanadium-dependent haloperoxidase [Pseudomonadota bacterium]
MKDTDESQVVEDVSRRRFMTKTAATGSIIAGGGTLLGATAAQAAPQKTTTTQALKKRALEAFEKRKWAASAYLSNFNPKPPKNNGDEKKYRDLRGAFFKTLPQNEFGEVDRSAYRELRRALRKGSFEAMEQVPLSPVNERALANPLASVAFDVMGPDSWSLRMPPAPAFNSDAIAAEMGEVYWQAITRDIPFSEYGTDPLIAQAAADMDNFTVKMGTGDPITPANLFRGETPGDLVGPYISQFLWAPTSWGLADLSQQFKMPLAGQGFGATEADWLAIQRGAVPAGPAIFDASARHIATGRDLAEYVHGDVLYQAYLTAALILLGYGADAIDPNNPYLASNTQGAFATFGGAEVVDMVAKVGRSALLAAWFQKWQVHRRLRPETFAGRAHFQSTGQRSYDINQELFDSDAVSYLLLNNGNLFLPLAYPEGSPTHPAYPAGHATVAGACGTILKAYFNEDYEIPAPVEASADGLTLNPWTGDALTVGGEIDKLAANISIGRDTAGVHYRSDGIDGLFLGEQVALGILQDYANTRAAGFGGFELTLFDGSEVTVGGDGVKRRRPRKYRNRKDRWGDFY